MRARACASRGASAQQAASADHARARDLTPLAATRADYESVVKLADGFNAADLRNVCTEAGMFAIRAERDFVTEEDFMKAVRKVSAAPAPADP